MKIGIIGAMNKETEGIHQKMDISHVETICSARTVVGNMHGHEIVCMTSNPGKVNAALCTQTMIMAYQPDVILSTGVAGGYKTLRINDLVIAQSLVQHDLDTTPLGDPLGYVYGLDVVNISTTDWVREKLESTAVSLGEKPVCGVFATGDQFISSNKKIDKIYKTFHAVAFEMESAAIACACLRAGVDFGAFRIISDNGDDQADEDYSKFSDRAANRSIELLSAFIFNM